MDGEEEREKNKKASGRSLCRRGSVMTALVGEWTSSSSSQARGMVYLNALGRRMAAQAQDTAVREDMRAKDVACDPLGVE